MNVGAGKFSTKPSALPSQEDRSARPILLLTINNGAAHTQAAEAIAEALNKQNLSTKIVEVSKFMSALGRFTHVTAYLWLVKNAPAFWEKIDAYQKKQTQTSPVWFYRRECRKLFDFARQIQPSAIVATEVGCGEIAALIKRDLKLNVPLVAVNLDYDADRAWLQPEVDFYSVAAEFVKTELVKLGAPSEKIRVLGVPLKPQFKLLNHVQQARKRCAMCEELGFDPVLPIVLVAGGAEGMGKIEQIIQSLLTISAAPQIAVLTGKNRNLKARCEKIAQQAKNAARLRVLGWTNEVARLYQSADLLISKLGLTFFEAMACGLPIIALTPPPGAEGAQYNLLEELGVGRAIKTLDQMSQVVNELLLTDHQKLARMRSNAGKLGQTGSATTQIADWIAEKVLVKLS